MKRFLALAISLFMIAGANTAVADEASDRAATVELIKVKYIPILDEQRVSLSDLQKKMKPDANLYKQVTAVLADFDNNYAAIVNGLANVNQAIQPIIDLCEEEIEEFSNSIYQLNVMLKKATKTITCIRGKTTKKVTGLAPKCPAGYKKK